MQAALEDELDNTDEPVSDSTSDADDVANPDAPDKVFPAKPAKPRRLLPDHLVRVRVTHELDEEHRHGECGGQLVPIGEEVTAQIGVIPARQSALIYSILESAKASNHSPLHYITVVLADIPNAKSLEDIEALLPW